MRTTSAITLMEVAIQTLKGKSLTITLRAESKASIKTDAEAGMRSLCSRESRIDIDVIHN